jgi:hypothetical protein
MDHGSAHKTPYINPKNHIHNIYLRPPNLKKNSKKKSKKSKKKFKKIGQKIKKFKKIKNFQKNGRKIEKIAEKLEEENDKIPKTSKKDRYSEKF